MLDINLNILDININIIDNIIFIFSIIFTIIQGICYALYSIVASIFNLILQLTGLNIPLDNFYYWLLDERDLFYDWVLNLPTNPSVIYAKKRLKLYYFLFTRFLASVIYFVFFVLYPYYFIFDGVVILVFFFGLRDFRDILIEGLERKKEKNEISDAELKYFMEFICSKRIYRFMVVNSTIFVKNRCVFDIDMFIECHKKEMRDSIKSEQNNRYYFFMELHNFKKKLLKNRGPDAKLTIKDKSIIRAKRMFIYKLQILSEQNEHKVVRTSVSYRKRQTPLDIKWFKMLLNPVEFHLLFQILNARVKDVPIEFRSKARKHKIASEREQIAKVKEKISDLRESFKAFALNKNFISFKNIVNSISLLIKEFLKKK